MSSTPSMVAVPPPIPNCYWVIPGQLLAGEHPGGFKSDSTRLRIERLLAAGVNVFVDLTMPEELATYTALLPMDVEHLRMPIRDHDVPDKTAHMTAILTCIRGALQSDKCVYVHCRAGIGRTGTVIGCLLVEGGLNGDDALYELNQLWQKCARSQSWPAVPETDNQVEYVRRWQPQLGLLTTSEEARPRTPIYALTAKPLPKPVNKAAPAATKATLAPALPVTGSRMPTGTGAVAAGTATLVAGVREPAREPVFDPQPPAHSMRQRYLGALLGLAVCDALAATTQQQQPGTFARVMDIVGGGPLDLPRGAWTDDTAMALCLAESLLACRGFDARDQVERYARWQQEGYLSATGRCLGITSGTARALAVAQWRRQLFAGSHDPQQTDPVPLSRIAPAVMFFQPFREQALEFASDSARTTCQAPRVLRACRLFACMLHAALDGQPKAQVLAPPWNLSESQPRSRIRGLIEGRYRTRPATAIRASDHILDVLEVALWAFERSNSFAEGALLAVNVGENSDVAGAVYGQLAGAFYGADAIPLSWRSSLINKELIEDLALKLLAQTKVDS